MAGCNIINNAQEQLPALSPTLAELPGITPGEADTSDSVLTATPTSEPPLTATPDAVVEITPTPIAECTDGEVYFSETNHFMAEDAAISIGTDSGKDGFITYTLDGTEPKKYSELYKKPLQLEAGTADAPNCYTIKAFSYYYASSATAFAERENLYEVIADADGGCYSPLLAALLKREDCRQYFLDRTDYYMEEAVTPERVNAVQDELMTECGGEIPYYYTHLEELKKTESSIWTSEAHREKSIETIRLFAKLRPEYMRQQLAELLGYVVE